MTDLFITIANRAIAAGWIVLAVVLLRLLLKRAPKWSHVLLWAVVALRLLLPWSFESILSLIPSKETIPTNIMLTQIPSIHTGIAAVNTAVNPVILDAMGPTFSSTTNKVQALLPVLAAIWLIGLAFMAVYALCSYGRLRFQVRTAVKLQDNVYESEHIGAPFVLGILRPRIYVPFGAAGLEHILAHEQAHIQRKDHLWKPLGFLLLSIFWFHPLLWLAYVLLCRDLELACDEKVIRHLSAVQRADYSQTLLACTIHRRAIAACPLAFGEVGVKTRVQSVLHYKKPAFWIVACALLAAVIAAVCFLTDPITKEPDSPFGHGYQVSNIVYQNGYYSFGWIVETAPAYEITEGQTLRILEDRDSDHWLTAGSFEPVELTGDNFDRYFRNQEIWNGQSAGKLRRSNEKAWRLFVSEDINSAFYYLLQQKNGDLYLVFGYYDHSEAGQGASDDSSIRTVFRLEQTDSIASQSLISGTAYVPYQCIYMTPVSSFLPWGGDNGYRYLIEDQFFTAINRSDGVIISHAGHPIKDADSPERIQWQWEEFPYTDEEWADLYLIDPAPVENISEQYNEILYQPIDKNQFLLRVNGDLWLVELRQDGNGRTYLWSIYSLAPEDAMGAAQWEFTPTLSSRVPWFTFVTDPAVEITASCTDSYVELTNRRTAFRWIPTTTEGTIPDGAVIRFSTKDGSHAGTVYITKTEDRNLGGAVYSATIVGTGLHLYQHPDGGAVISFTE